jgi:NifU-like protein involved in Fe-S cluster formation
MRFFGLGIFSCILYMIQPTISCISAMLRKIKGLTLAEFKNITTSIIMEENLQDMELAQTCGISYLGLNLRRLLSTVKNNKKRHND